MKYAIENGIIDMSYVKAQIEMKRNEEILSKHPYKITKGNDGYSRTYLPDEDKKRKMVKKKNRSDIEDAIIEYYSSKNKKTTNLVTFDDTYFNWRKSQDELLSDNSKVKYNTDYTRFFKDTDFSKKDINQINEEIIQVFIVSSIKRLSLTKKACKTLFGYIKNTINSAKKKKVIKDNPMEFMEAKKFYKYCIENTKPTAKKIISDEDMKKIYGQLHQDYEDNPSYIPSYAVELASLTGMRVGEISALRWDNINDKFILINQSEKYNRLEKRYYIDRTKNQKDRIFPMTDEIKDLFNRIKKIEIQNGFICEWVFANSNGRIHAPTISSCLKNKCRQLGIDEKGIHAFRRTLNSKLRCEGVSATVAASMLGHTEEVNEQYYTFDITTLEEKSEIISKINKKTG